MIALFPPATQFVTVCELDDIPIGLGRAFRIGEDSIAIFRTRSGRVFAVANSCPHKGGPLADGMLAGEQIVCPMHSFRFDPNNGECDQPGICAIATYPVEVVDGSIRVRIESC